MTRFASQARRSLVVTLVAGMAMALLLGSASSRRGPQTTPAAQALLSYTPVTGAIFNRPIGTTAEQRRIFTHVNNAIAATPAGATIRIAVFSFSEKSTADRLLAAKARGVNVQLIFNDHTIYAQEARLRKALGANPNARSFTIYCHLSCRGSSGNMHDKIFMFSRAGAAENVTMVGSNNMTANNAVNQWSDIYTVANDPALYFTFSGVFDQMKYDKAMSKTYYSADINGYQPQFYPYAGVSQLRDPLYQTLSKVVCTGAAEGTGQDGATVLRMSQHAWNGDRGVYLAKKVASLRSQGCLVSVIYGVGIGSQVKSILANAGVRFPTIRHRSDRTHQKTLMISGNYDGNPGAQLVYTGSHNWSDGALRRDEVIFRVDNPTAFAQYLKNFQDIWHNG